MSCQTLTDCDGRIVNRTRLPRPSLISLIPLLGASVIGAERVHAQPATVPSEILDVYVDSGLRVSKAETDAEIVFSEKISVAGASWMRLHFADVQLGAGDGSGKSFLRITSMEDGAEQTLDKDALKIWENTSAYFNGDEVLVELVADADSKSVRVAVDKIAIGTQEDGELVVLQLCGTDDRVRSFDVRAGRVRYRHTNCTLEGIGTAFLYNDRPTCMLTAGHVCFAIYGNNCVFVEIVEFNVPLSTSAGVIRASDPRDQYPIAHPIVLMNDFQNDGFANDWCRIGVQRNTFSGLTPLEAQGASYDLAATVPAADQSTLRVTGFGSDPAYGVPLNQYNFTQQTATGPYQWKTGTTVGYAVDAAGGNSGGAVERISPRLVYAIHT